MNKRNFGRTDPLPSELCLNTDNFGPVIDAASAFAMLNVYHVSGCCFIQSNSRGGNSATSRIGEGSSGEIVGRWIVAREIDWDSLTLASRIRLPRRILVSQATEMLRPGDRLLGLGMLDQQQGFRAFLASNLQRT